MQDYEELGKFKPCDQSKYDQIQSSPTQASLYIHKNGFLNVTVSAPNPSKRLHGWRIKYLQITQFATQKGTRQKAVAQIQFDGEMIFTLMETFNKMVGKQILQYVDSISTQLRNWCDAPIVNIFLVQQRTQQSLGFKHGFIKITPLLVYLQKSYYFQYERWIADPDSQVPEIEIAQKVQGTSSYAGMMQYVCQQIKRSKERRRKIKQKKIMQIKMKQQMQRMEEIKKKDKKANRYYQQEVIDISPYERDVQCSNQAQHQ